MKKIPITLLIIFISIFSYGQTQESFLSDSVKYKFEYLETGQSVDPPWFFVIGDRIIELDSTVRKNIDTAWIKQIDVRKQQTEDAEFVNGVYIQISEPYAQQLLQELKIE